jgi:HK97 family phage major capsid protein
MEGLAISDPERDAVKSHIARYYLKMASVFSDDTIVAPWNKRSAPAPASGKPGVKPQPKPGVAGKPNKQKDKTMRSFDTQIQEFETSLADVRQQMSDLMEGSEDGVLTGENAVKYDQLTEQSVSLRANIKRLRAHQEISETAAPVQQTPAPAPVQRRQPVEVKPVEKDPALRGIGVARMVIALVQARGNHHVAAELARQHYKDMPEVALALRAAVDAGDTTTSGWASQLVPAAVQMQNEFIELLRPATLIGRIPGLRRVPFNVAVPLQSGGGTYGWVGEARPKPVTKAAFQSVTLRWAKAAGIIVITRELARFSSPSAEAIVRNELVAGTSRFLDSQFIDDGVGEVANVSPASILNSVSPGSPSGTTAEAFRYDLSLLVADFISNNQDPTTAVLLISATTAMNLALMRNALGQREFPDISVKGGTIDGIPTVVSESVGTRVALVNASDILVADDGIINIDISEQATIEMSTTPLNGEESPIDNAVFKSLWQNNLVGLRVETFMTWKRARNSSVAWVDGVAYAPTNPGSPA